MKFDEIGFNPKREMERRFMTWRKSIADLFKRGASTTHEASDDDSVAMQVIVENGFSLIAPGSLRRTNVTYPVSIEDLAIQAAKREIVKRELSRELHALLKHLGYKRTGSFWSKESELGISQFEFQKSSYGADCYFNAAAIGAKELPILTRPNGLRYLHVHRLAEYCPELQRSEVVDGVNYARLHDELEFRHSVMTVIRARMIPWMEIAHKLPPDRALPMPADMVSVRVFR